jgi:hypothetical protein
LCCACVFLFSSRPRRCSATPRRPSPTGTARVGARRCRRAAANSCRSPRPWAPATRPSSTGAAHTRRTNLTCLQNLCMQVHQAHIHAPSRANAPPGPLSHAAFVYSALPLTGCVTTWETCCWAPWQLRTARPGAEPLLERARSAD